MLKQSPLVASVVKGCAKHNYCSGHGFCRHRKVTNTGKVAELCECFPTYGSFDCLERTCPYGPAWGDIPNDQSQAHQQAECSAKGICNRVTGICTCSPGYEGHNCARSKCPSSISEKTCSGHGQCLNMRQLATKAAAFPLTSSGAAGQDMTNYRANQAVETNSWDYDSIYGCLCDSMWSVGLLAGETQASEWFGYDCSKRRCPSGNNPYTLLDEQDCSHTNFSTLVNDTVGSSGNLCYVECSNQGLCDYTSGECKCFSGRFGAACELGIDTSPTSFYADSTVQYSSEGVFNFVEVAPAVEKEFYGNPGT